MPSVEQHDEVAEAHEPHDALGDAHDGGGVLLFTMVMVVITIT